MDRREEALAASRHSIEVASQLDDPFSHALACFFGGAAAQMLGDDDLSAERAEASLRLASEHDLAQPRAWSLALHGVSRVAGGEAAKGLAALEGAIEDMNRMRSGHLLPYLWGLLADARLQAGQAEAALAAAVSGVGSAASTGEDFFSAELHRLRGEALARLGRASAAAAAFDQAEAIAAGQDAHRLLGKTRASRAAWS
jgi:adenylate cyclase